jgi:hypothetical protein
MSDDYAEKAVKEILNGETAEGLTVFVDDDSGATKLYGINLSIGWADQIVASGMYDHDARGVAYALGHIFDCTVDVEATNA